MPYISQSGVLKPRVLLAFGIGLVGIGMTVLSVAAPVSGVWAIAFSPNTGATEYLEDVTCTSASDCWAVGFYYNNTTAQTLIEHWNGTNWAFVTSANTSVIQSNQLFGVTCVSASDCSRARTRPAGRRARSESPAPVSSCRCRRRPGEASIRAVSSGQSIAYPIIALIVASPNTNVTITHS